MSIMASSSVSQEDLDREENDISIRKPRLRMTRTRQSASRIMDLDPDHSSSTNHDSKTGRQSPNGPQTTEGAAGGPETGVDVESPKLVNRAKDKRVRPNHVNKGKAQRDRRKLREKRRSTGVVHLPSTESTGEEDDEMVASTETKKNTVCNEVIDKPSEERIVRTCPTRRNKSPSDLDADDEDNQDYDSAVNQSDPRSQIEQSNIISATALRLKSPGFADGKLTSTYETKTAACIAEDNVKLLEKEREENKRLLRQVGQKDRRIEYLGKEIEMLNQLLENEREEIKRLLRQLGPKDRRIEYLEKEIEMLNQDLHPADAETERLKEDNKIYFVPLDV